MDKVIINDFVMKLGFNSKEADKGFDRIEKRVLKLNKKLERSQKTLTRGYKESVVDSNKKEQALQRIIGLKKRAQKIEKHQSKMSSGDIALQTKLGRLEKISLDIESKKLRILIQKRNLLANKVVKINQVKRATIATATAEERAARSSARFANNSERASRANSRSAHSLRNSVASANKMQNFILKGALAYGAFQGAKTVASSTMTTGMASSRSQVGLEAVASHIGRGMGMDDEKANRFASDQTTYARDLSTSLNRDMLSTQESWRDILGATITTIEEHGEEGFKNVQDVFKGVIESSAVFKLSPSETKLMLLGTKQTMQKGKLQAEEITRQMGERSPLLMGELLKAVKTVRKDDSIVMKDVFKLMSLGKLHAYDIMPELGRNLSKMSRRIAGGDLQAYMQKSAAGAWDGVTTSIQSIQIGIFEEMDKPLARMLTTVKELLSSMEFIWQPAGVFASNIFDLMDNDLTKLLSKMKKGEGFFANLFGTEGGADGWEERKANMTPEQRKENSLEMLEKSKKVYASIRGFFIGDEDVEGIGGFAGGVIYFLQTAQALILSMKEPLEELMESMGFGTGEDGLKGSHVGFGAGLWLTSNLTGATSMFVAMTEAFGSLAKVLPDITKLLASPKLLAILSALGIGGGSLIAANANDGKSTIDKIKTTKNILDTPPREGAGVLEKHALNTAKSAMILHEWTTKPIMSSTGTVITKMLEDSPEEVKKNAMLGSIFGGNVNPSMRKDNYNFATVDYSNQMRNARSVFDTDYLGMSHKNIKSHSSMQPSNFGNMTQGLSPANMSKFMTGEVMITVKGADGHINYSEMLTLHNIAEEMKAGQNVMEIDISSQ